jgi:hypothetical protein
MTSNTEFAIVDQPTQNSVHYMLQAVPVSPFKLTNHSSAAFKPIQSSKMTLSSLPPLDQTAKRPGFQLVAKCSSWDKENASPALIDQKKRLQSKVLRNLEQKLKPPTDVVEAQFSDRTQNRKSFSLGQFNSILLGRRPTLDFKRKARGSVFQIKSSKPTRCSVILKGLTIQVKIAN